MSDYLKKTVFDTPTMDVHFTSTIADRRMLIDAIRGCPIPDKWKDNSFIQGLVVFNGDDFFWGPPKYFEHTSDTDLREIYIRFRAESATTDPDGFGYSVG